MLPLNMITTGNSYNSRYDLANNTSNQSKAMTMKNDENSRSTQNNNYDLRIINDDNQARFQQIFAITTPHDSRSISIPNSEDESRINNQINDNIHETESNYSTNYQQNENQNEYMNEIELATRNLIQFQQMPPLNLQPDVLRFLKTLLLKSTMDQDYDKAHELEEILQYVSINYENSTQSNLKEEQLQNIESKIAQLRSELNSKIQEWDKIMNTFQRQQKRERDNLQAQFNNEQAEFEQHWGDPNNLTQFNKPSSKLLQLRKQQKCLALAKHFEDAKEVQKLAKELEKYETEQAKQKAIAAMKIAYDNMITSQQKELDCFDQHKQRLEVYLNLEKDKVILPYQMQIKQLEIARDQGKPTNKKPIKTVFVSTRKTRACKNEAAFPPASPRTARALSNYRISDEPKKLDLSGINVKRILSSRRSASSVRVRRKAKH